MPTASINPQELLTLVALVSAMGILLVVTVHVMIKLIDEEFL